MLLGLVRGTSQLILIILLLSSQARADGVWQWDNYPALTCSYHQGATPRMLLASLRAGGKTCALNEVGKGAAIVTCDSPAKENFYLFNSKTLCLKARSNYENQEFTVDCSKPKCVCGPKSGVSLEDLKKHIEKSGATCGLDNLKSYSILGCKTGEHGEFHFSAKTEAGCIDAAKTANMLRGREDTESAQSD